MQSNPRLTFAPSGSGSRRYNMPAHHIEGQSMEHRDLPYRGASMQQPSHVSMPNGTFSTAFQSQNFEDGYKGIKSPNSTVDSKELMQIPEEVMLTPQLDSRAMVYHTPKREIYIPLVGDWLSSSQDQIEDQSLQDAQDQQQMFSHDGHSVSPYVAPNLLLSNGGGNLLLEQTYAPYDNRMHEQTFAGTFAPDTADSPFMFNVASNDLDHHGYTDSNSFAPGVGQYSYPTQPHPFAGGFDFNNSSLYGADHYAIDHRPYDIPQPPNILPMQDDSIGFAARQPTRLQGIDRDDLDEKLIEWRGQGITYKEIQVMGNWGLKESTLRGRFRTLTKPKEQRLRKPQWDNEALSALAAGVDHLAPSAVNSRRTTEDLGKVPWKKVTEWMQKEKGCYPYGYHTIKKKYRELLGSQKMQRDVNQWRRIHGEHPL